MSTGQRSLALVAAVGAGCLVASTSGLDSADSTILYQLIVTALLGFGLYASTCGIDLTEFRSHLRTVLIAVTLGVVAKAVMIFAVMYLVFRDPRYLLLGIAVAQIDPLSVAAMRAKSRMSESAKTLLAAWASFDDPMTVLLTLYATAFFLRPDNGAYDFSGGLLAFGGNLLLNAVLAGVVYVVWHLAGSRGIAVPAWLTALGLLVVGVVAVRFSLMLGVAVIGLFVRPRRMAVVDRLAQGALMVAAFAVGLVLAGGISPGRGLVLGLAAYSAQIVVALVLTIPRMWRGDRGRLALGQQNGMTAIVLALLLEPALPGTTGIVAPAIVVVYLLYLLANALWDRSHRGLAEAGTAEVSPRPLGRHVRASVEPAG